MIRSKQALVFMCLKRCFPQCSKSDDVYISYTQKELHNLVSIELPLSGVQDAT